MLKNGTNPEDIIYSTVISKHNTTFLYNVTKHEDKKIHNNLKKKSLHGSTL